MHFEFDKCCSAFGQRACPPQAGRSHEAHCPGGNACRAVDIGLIEMRYGE